MAKQWGVTREAQDQFALQSQQKCEAAQKSGAFKEEIVPVTITSRKGMGTAEMEGWVGCGGWDVWVRQGGGTTIEVHKASLLPNRNKNVKHAAQKSGFKEEIVPVTITSRKGLEYNRDRGCGGAPGEGRDDLQGAESLCCSITTEM